MCIHERERSRKRRAESAAAKTRGSRTWQQVREIAERRDGYRCRQCGSAEKIEAHHVQGLAEGGSAFSLENIITLCADCHRKEGAKAKGGFLSSAVPPPTPASARNTPQESHALQIFPESDLVLVRMPGQLHA